MKYLLDHVPGTPQACRGKIMALRAHLVLWSKKMWRVRQRLAVMLLLCGPLALAARPHAAASAANALAMDLQSPAQSSSATSAQSQPAAQVIMKNFQYQPAQLKVKLGETVEFRNDDIYSHTVTADDGSFNSGLIPSGKTWTLKITQPGTIAYHCIPHPNMKAQLIAGGNAQPGAENRGPSPTVNFPHSPQEFHPILVNFTAALLPLAFLSELLGLWFKRASLHNAGAWMVLYAAIITPLTGAAGWWWKSQVGPALPTAVITVHEWLGTSLAVIFILLAIWRWRIQKRNAVPGVSYMVVVAIVALALVYQGSLGGLMVFGK
ncbi:MAG TPA: DUF2231 domain-containing protein [Candidatus Angelobacter sp.]|nr:DUF2231 domain-containing protein [Candidatus Angelobacter sp.]